MTTFRTPARLDLETYFVADAAAAGRLEFLDGAIYAMAGGTFTHGRIASNVNGELRARLKGRACQVVGGDVRVFIPEANVATYPDAAVFCGPVQFLAKRQDTVLNPTLLVEVLSPSTHLYDRGEKFEFYKHIPAFQEYVLVHQDRLVVEQFTRQRDGVWMPTLVQGRDAVMELGSIGIQLPLQEVFDGVELAT